MGFRLLPMMISNAKHIYKLQSALTEKKRFVVPITREEDEFWFHHSMGGLTIPCNVDAFVDVTSQLNTL
uniref:Uncharacterized protein n=1 Tax=Solanum lycopersicum TaxID=4081 RepID=A0A3Q7IHD4_SOLLC